MDSSSIGTINTWENGEPKHKELLRPSQMSMHDLNEKLYDRILYQQVNID